MAFFSKEYYSFFKELNENNNKEWFDKNRKRYETEVKEPFKEFVEHLIAKVHGLDSDVNIEAKDAIFRINRDIRFSNDKTPYKTHFAAVISSGGRKDLSKPGQYFALGLNGLEIYGGMYQPGKEMLYNIRQHISYNLELFDKIINEKEFKRFFGGVRGEKNKVIPKEFKEDAKVQELLYNKSFYYQYTHDPKVISEDRLEEIWMKAYTVGKPFRDFLYEGSLD